MSATFLVGAQGGPERSLYVSHAGARGQAAQNGASGAWGKRVAAPYAAGGALNISDLALNQVVWTRPGGHIETSTLQDMHARRGGLLRSCRWCGRL